MFYGYYESPMGLIELECKKTKLVMLTFIRPDEKKESANEPIIEQVKKWLECYFNGENPDPNDIPIEPDGNQFRIHVWETISDIPYGTTKTYGEIAEIVAKKMGKAKISSQAIGTAIGHNPIPIIVPCHRVIARDKSIGGFGLGLVKKAELLSLEGIDYCSYKEFTLIRQNGSHKEYLINLKDRRVFFLILDNNSAGVESKGKEIDYQEKGFFKGQWYALYQGRGLKELIEND